MEELPHRLLWLLSLLLSPSPPPPRITLDMIDCANPPKNLPGYERVMPPFLSTTHQSNHPPPKKKRKENSTYEQKIKEAREEDHDKESDPALIKSPRISPPPPPPPPTPPKKKDSREWERRGGEMGGQEQEPTGTCHSHSECFAMQKSVLVAYKATICYYTLLFNCCTLR